MSEWAAQSLREFRDKINADHEVMERQLDVIGGRNSSPLAFWRKHHPQYQAMDYETEEWCGTPVHDAMAEARPPSSGVTFHPES